MTARNHAIFLIIVAIISFLIYFVGVSMESRTYNKLTGASTTWWDAMWVDLKVTTPAK